MVSFSCEGCGDILTKKKLDPHRNQCWGASFTCIDCMVHFQGTDYRSHTSCMSEAQKYQGHLYRGEKKGKGGQKKQDQALVPHKAPEPTTTDVAKLNVPPKAPSPPPNGTTLPPGVNVFDYMDTPAKIESAPIVTPAPKRERDETSKSDKKRKRGQDDREDQEMADTTPGLHSGLTGGLNRMLSGPDFGNGDDVAQSPLSPKKRSKKDKSEKDTKSKSSSDKSSKKSGSADARENTQVVTYRSPAELFLSFITKGPDSDRGLSINKALKRYHRERQSRGEKDDGDKDLWKDLRIRKNERGEYVLFV